MSPRYISLLLTCGSCAGKDAEALPSAPGQAQAEGGLTGSELPEGHEREQNPQAQTFRDFYMKTFSSAFASELFDLRQVYITPHALACFMSLPGP